MIYDFSQYSPEWWKIREQRLTGSHAQAIGVNGKGLKTYTRKIMSEYYSSAQIETYSNDDMRRGLEREDKAASEYSIEHMTVLKKVGFVTRGDHVGVSPDRLADENGLVEIKCPKDSTYLDLLLDKKIDTKYIWQMQMQLLICEKDWCDYVVYNPNFETRLFVQRIEPDAKKFKALEEGIESGIKMIKDIEERMAL